MPNDDKYPVGYKRPPKSSRWKKGQSGNPKGRPKGSGQRQIGKLMRKVANEKVEVTVFGEPRVAIQLELAFRGVMNAAIKGNPSAFRAFMEYYTHEELAQKQQIVFRIFESEKGL